MKPTPRDLRLLARQIIEREIAGRETPAALAEALDAAFGRLYHLMSALVGHVGFTAVMSRAAHLTKAGRPSAGPGLRVTATGTIAGLAEHIEREGAPATTAYVEDLLANVMSLLCAFIGEALTSRLVGRVWTDLPGVGAGTRGDQHS